MIDDVMFHMMHFPPNVRACVASQTCRGVCLGSLVEMSGTNREMAERIVDGLMRMVFPDGL